MSASVPLRHVPTAGEERALDRARIGGALRRIYAEFGFAAAVHDAQAELLSLAEGVREAGGDQEGFIG